jgi:hypothetical protein
MPKLRNFEVLWSIYFLLPNLSNLIRLAQLAKPSEIFVRLLEREHFNPTFPTSGQKVTPLLGAQSGWTVTVASATNAE